MHGINYLFKWFCKILFCLTCTCIKTSLVSIHGQWPMLLMYLEGTLQWCWLVQRLVHFPGSPPQHRCWCCRTFQAEGRSELRKLLYRGESVPCFHPPLRVRRQHGNLHRKIKYGLYTEKNPELNQLQQWLTKIALPYQWWEPVVCPSWL